MVGRKFYQAIKIDVIARTITEVYLRKANPWGDVQCIIDGPLEDVGRFGNPRNKVQSILYINEDLQTAPVGRYGFSMDNINHLYCPYFVGNGIIVGVNVVTRNVVNVRTTILKVSRHMMFWSAADIAKMPNLRQAVKNP